MTTAELRALLSPEDYSSFETRVARSALTDSMYDSSKPFCTQIRLFLRFVVLVFVVATTKTICVTIAVCVQRYVTCVNEKCANVMERVPVSQKDARGVSKIELHKVKPQ